MRTCVLQLGRWGDILNILPFVRQNDFDICVSEEFASLAGSIDYATVFTLPHPPEALQEAIPVALERFKNLVVSQVYMNSIGPDYSLHGGFMAQAYRNVWHLSDFYFHKFDVIPNFVRDEEAEASLVQQVCQGVKKPVLACLGSGVSSPLSSADALLGRIQMQFPGRVIDISKVRTPRFIDMLGLFDVAEHLFVSDCGILHLAGAHRRIPYTAFLNNQPNPWYRGYCRGNCVATCDYSAVASLL